MMSSIEGCAYCVPDSARHATACGAQRAVSRNASACRFSPARRMGRSTSGPVDRAAQSRVFQARAGNARRTREGAAIVHPGGAAVAASLARLRGCGRRCDRIPARPVRDPAEAPARSAVPRSPAGRRRAGDHDDTLAATVAARVVIPATHASLFSLHQNEVIRARRPGRRGARARRRKSWRGGRARARRSDWPSVRTSRSLRSGL